MLGLVDFFLSANFSLRHDLLSKFWFIVVLVIVLFLLLLSVFVLFVVVGNFINPNLSREIRVPYLVKATAAARTELPIPTGVCCIFVSKKEEKKKV